MVWSESADDNLKNSAMLRHHRCTRMGISHVYAVNQSVAGGDHSLYNVVSPTAS